MAPVSKVMVGVPVIFTVSLKVTVTAITSPALYEPFAVELLTSVMVGAVVSTMMFLLAPNEFAAPGVAKVNTPLFNAISVIKP